MKHINKLVASLAVMVVMGTVIAATPRPAHAAFTTYQSGSVGQWLGAPDLTTSCVPGSPGWITSLSPKVGRSPASSGTQIIWMLPVLERYNANTRTWETYLYPRDAYGNQVWQKRTVGPTQLSAQFSAQRFINLPHGFFYRTGYVFQWETVGATPLGQAFIFNSQAEYYQGYINPMSRGDWCQI